MAELEAQLSNDHIVVADASLSSIWVANYLTAKFSRRFITPRGQAGLGWGFPLALGAKIGNPDRPVFCTVGDGGFAHVWSELETARRHGINVVVAVMNNAVLGYQKHAMLAAWREGSRSYGSVKTRRRRRPNSVRWRSSGRNSIGSGSGS